MRRLLLCWLALTAAVVAGLSLAPDRVRANMVQMPFAAGGGGTAGTILFQNALDLLNNGGTTNVLNGQFAGSNLAIDLVLVFVAGDVLTGTDDITSVTVAGSPATLVTKRTTAPAVNRFTYVYARFSATGMGNPITVSVNCTATHYLMLGAAEYTGAVAIDASTTTAFANGATSGSGNLTTIYDKAWVVQSVSTFSASTTYSGTVASVRAHDATYDSWSIVDSGGPITPPRSVTASWSDSGVAAGNAPTQMIVSLR